MIVHTGDYVLVSYQIECSIYIRLCYQFCFIFVIERIVFFVQTLTSNSSCQLNWHPFVNYLCMKIWQDDRSSCASKWIVYEYCSLADWKPPPYIPRYHTDIIYGGFRFFLNVPSWCWETLASLKAARLNKSLLLLNNNLFYYYYYNKIPKIAWT